MATSSEIEPRTPFRLPGLLMFLGMIVAAGALVGLVIGGGIAAQGAPVVGVGAVLCAGLGGMAWLYCWRGFAMLEPNQAIVALLFGSYAGTYGRDAWHFFNPLLSQRKVSTRVQAFETPHLEVNEKGGRPIMIGAVVTWSVSEPEAALLQVEDYLGFLKNRTEIALREVAAAHPYETEEEGKDCLRGNQGSISRELRERLLPYAKQAGISIQDIAITQLAYAPEIAGIMLVKQQAESLLAARRVIVEGAVRIAGDAIKQLEAEGHPIPDSERGRALVNLLTVLASDRGTQPTVSVDGS